MMDVPFQNVGQWLDRLARLQRAVRRGPAAGRSPTGSPPHPTESERL
jgi:hypothetical protein